MIFLAFLCTFDDKILVCYLVMMQDDSCSVVSQSYRCISSVFPPCLSEHTRAVMNSTLKNVLYSGSTDTKSSINYPEHPGFEQSAQDSCAENSICPFTAAGWTQQPWAGNRNPFTLTDALMNILNEYPALNQGVWMFPHRNAAGSLLPVITLIQAVSSNGFVKRVFTPAHKPRNLWLAIRHTKWDFSSLWCAEHRASGMSLLLAASITPTCC